MTGARSPTAGRRLRFGVVGALVGLAALARLPLVHRPLSADEGGFLAVAAQWSPGRSLYGNYWVDRPPLLIAFFGVADRLGGAVGLRLLGLLAVLASILLAAAVGAVAADLDGWRRTPSSGLAAAVTATILLVSPLSGAEEVDGELVAVPLVLLGTLLVLLAAREPRGRRRLALLLAAGATGAAAALVKQNVVDVGVLLVVAALTLLPHDRVRTVLSHLAVAAAGALAMLAVVVGWAASRGTSPAGLFDAVVTFRLQADQVISRSASAATTLRLHRDLKALLLSGAPLGALAFVVTARRRGARPASRLRAPAAAVLAWECVAALAGGSYWNHYLVGLVPGLVLCVGVAAPRASVGPVGRRLLVGGLGYATVVATLAVLRVATATHTTTDQPLAAWLDEHDRAGDSLVVAFGHADLHATTGLPSPYPELWSLPVRVRDPRLAGLTRVLDGPRRPTWLVTGPTLQLWALHPLAAERAVARHYRPVGLLGGRFRVYRARAGLRHRPICADSATFGGPSAPTRRPARTSPSGWACRRPSAGPGRRCPAAAVPRR